MICPLKPLNIPISLKILENFHKRFDATNARQRGYLSGLITQCSLILPKRTPPELSEVTTRDHAVARLKERFPQYGRGYGAERREQIDRDLGIFCAQGYILQEKRPGENGSLQDWIITHPFPAWDQFEVVVSQGPRAAAHKVVTIEQSRYGQERRINGKKIGDPPWEMVRGYGSLLASHLITWTNELPRLRVIEFADGAVVFGQVFAVHKGRDFIVSGLSSHQILDLLVMAGQFTETLGSHIDRMIECYGLGGCEDLGVDWLPIWDDQKAWEVGHRLHIRTRYREYQAPWSAVLDSLIIRKRQEVASETTATASLSDPVVPGSGRSAEEGTGGLRVPPERVPGPDEDEPPPPMGAALDHGPDQ